jgi:3-hydroxyisobutyrate dehydrogenase-like beta-hydroxyacid dehydrogenase
MQPDVSVATQTPESDLRIGFLGAGRMGHPMVINLARAGYGVTVYDPFAAPSAELERGGVTRVHDVRELASTDYSISMLPNGPLTYDALFGIDSLFETPLTKNHTHIAMGTLGSVWAGALFEQCASKGIGFADATVSGSVSMAESAQLSCMVGAEQDVFERIQPVLAAMSRTQFHVGRAGSGSTMKLAIAALLAAVNQGIVECLSLAESGGISRELAYDVLSASAGASTYSGYKREAFLDPDGTPVAASVAIFAKDIALVEEEANALGLELPVSRAASAVLRHALESGLGDRDLASIITLNSNSVY